MDLNKVQQISLQEENKSCPAQRNLSLVVRIPLDSLGEGKMMLEEKIKKREEEIAKVNTDLVDGVGKMMLAGICRTEVEVRGGEEQPRSYICD